MRVELLEYKINEIYTAFKRNMCKRKKKKNTLKKKKETGDTNILL